MGTLGQAFYAVGFWIRETGQAIDRLGSHLQGNYLFQEQLSRHRPLMNLFDKYSSIHKDAFVARSASLLGDVHDGPASSIWYGCVLRVFVGIACPALSKVPHVLVIHGESNGRVECIKIVRYTVHQDT
ncbi:gamma carbonic anhydrase 1, mitochondrial-like [Vigna umbellata]|uniref:gamma carbonic anhydrase 1, mitochondrial-like n=1 Tax=Vigna umbellata TaxID=87088 RepID=UPI001F5F64FF|nr:gamma carbonic anhydrase 1, mitochondrial-like [Vigna umbellata]